MNLFTKQKQTYRYQKQTYGYQTGKVGGRDKPKTEYLSKPPILSGVPLFKMLS